jgi:hypothetical protein
MSERYLITGVQLGMLKAYADTKDLKELKKLVDRIVDEQFIGRSEKSIQYDTEKYWRENVAQNPEVNIKKKVRG